MLFNTKNQVPWHFFHSDQSYQETSISPILANDGNERRDQFDVEKTALTGDRNGKCFHLFKNI